MLPPELQQHLAPALRQLEQYRQALRADEQQARQRRRANAGRIAAICALCLLAAGAAGWLRGFAAINTIVIVAAAIGLLVALIYATKPITEFSTAYEDAYKTEINNAIVKHFSPALSYIAQDGISREAFESSGLFAAPDRYGTSDLVSGALGRTQLRLARVFAEKSHTTGSGKNQRTTYETLFDGVMLIADTGKIIPKDTLARALAQRDGARVDYCFKDTSVIMAFHSKDDDDDDNDPFDPDFDWPATDAAQLGKIHEHYAFYLGIIDALGS